MILSLLVVLGLYEQALVRLLAERFTDTEYMLLDARQGRAIAVNWADAERPIPVGSLTKPFLAAGGRDREFECKPGVCWLPRGHGRIRMEEAIAQSCNAWFIDYAADVRAVGRDLPTPPSYEGVTLIGLRPDWLIAPLVLARAYPSVAAHDRRVRDGMLASAVHGTAQRIGMRALSKTGTAACSHRGGGPGDGLVVALWPSERPKYVLMVRVHGTTGAMAAAKAGELLRVVRDGR